MSLELKLAAEQACDEAASEVVGDPLAVAETLLAVERLALRANSLGGVAIAFGECALEARVRALVEPPLHRRPPRLLLPLALASFVLLAGAPWLHHLTESVLSLFVS